MFTVIKIVVSAIIIWIITEVSRRFPAQGGVIAAMPIISILSIVWLYAQGEQTASLSKFAYGVAGAIPSTVFMLLIVGFALQHSLHLFASLALGMGGWVVCFMLQDMVVKHFTGSF
ncbi:DUF3147 family protein [Brevibacillus centrosporus]|uniref:DUF3147 family protein n=1 Tax=Brevibacillus centrosporus TaxID=54910 RepID=UPI003B011E02